MHLVTYASSKTFFSHTNLVGSTRRMTDQIGTITTDCYSWPFGDFESCASGSMPGPVHYAGYERDAETGLDHMWFRYYNSRLGRFMSADPPGRQHWRPAVAESVCVCAE